MRVIKRLLSAAVCAAMLFAMGGCQNDSEAGGGMDADPFSQAVSGNGSGSCAEDTDGDEAAAVITVTDHAGNEVTLPKKIERIVVADIYPLPSVLAVFFDSADKLVGIAGPSMTAAENSILSELYPEILDASTGFIDGTSINIEEVMSLDPDVVFYSAGSSGIKEELDRAGIPAVAISASNWDYDAIETLNRWIELLGQIFPENDRTRLAAEYSAQKLELVRERVSAVPKEDRERAFFLFQYSDSTITTSGKHFFGQYWAEAVGAVNVGEELDSDNSAAVDLEQIYSWDPSIIFITNFNSAAPDDLYSNTVGAYDWSGVKAVADRRVYKMPLGMYRSYTPGIDTPITLLWMAKTTYPELFEDINITEETKAYYKELFGVELTDGQAERIFAPVSEASAY